MVSVSRWQEIERQLKRTAKSWWKLYWASNYGKAGLIIIVIFAIMAIFAPVLTPYTPDFEAPSKDALVTYLYAFHTDEKIDDMIVGYTQLRTASPLGGDWLILNHGHSIEGIYVQNPKIAVPENSSKAQADIAPWEVNEPPITFYLNISTIPGIGSDEVVKDMVFLAQSTSDLNFHYNGENQRSDFAGELVFVTQSHLVIYDMYNFYDQNYSRYKVVSLGFEPTWVTADVTSVGGLTSPVIYSTTYPPTYPARYIMVGNAHSFALFFHYYTYSGDPNLPDIDKCLIQIYPTYSDDVTTVNNYHTFTDRIKMKPLLFYNDNLYTKDQNVIVVPLENSTVLYKGFDEHSQNPFPGPGDLPLVVPSNIASRITATTLSFSLTASPGFYFASQDLGVNPIFLPARDGNNAVIYYVIPRGDIAANLKTINLREGEIDATPQVFKSGNSLVIYTVKYSDAEGDSYLYKLAGNLSAGFTIQPFESNNGTMESIPIKGERVVYNLYVQENNQFFFLTETNKFYLFDLHSYQKSGTPDIIRFSYYHWKTLERNLFPYPSGSTLSKFIFVGSLQGSRYTAKAAAYDIFGAYYCADTNTVGLTLLKGESRLPLPPGRYISGNLYILGTDAQGHDIWTWLVYGSRVAFLVGIMAAFIQVVIGSLYGVLSGFKGGWTDTVLMRFADIMLTLPFLPIILILTSIVGRSIWNIIFVLGIFGWAGISRVIRAQTLSLKNRPFVDAARVAGASGWRIMISHILPNVLPFAFLYMTLGVAGAILSEAALSFLGLGDPQAVSWGQMLSTIQTSGATMYAWWWLLPPGLAITLISLGFYLVGRAFDEILNPRLRKR